MKSRGDSFRRNGRFDKLLGRDLLAEVTVSAPADVSRARPGLEAIWRGIGHSDKWLHYFPIYERVFGHLAGTPVRLLEIGVQNGGSLRMWKQYLGGSAQIVGVDIDPRCAEFDDPGNGIHVRIGSQADENFMQAVAAELGPFDAILDDGSHLPSHMIRSFGSLFGTGLVPGGVYVVEDIQATYWDSHRDVPHAFSDFVRDLIDIQHAVYHGQTDAAFRPESSRYRRELPAPALAVWIDRIEVDDSVVTVRKTTQEKQLPVALKLEPRSP